MNFFKAQDKARRHTSRLIFLFALAVICLIILTNLLFIATFSYMGTDETEPFISVVKNSYDRDSVIVISIGVSLLILLGSIYKVISLSKGGPAIAEMLGGQLVPQSTTDAEERKLLNIVEEMSIAAGMPIPQVYILEESSINAFAAGQSQSNAVIGVTRGSLSQLSRDELQGVIAHEFSHILNGDMRLNLRLMGLLHGILLIGIIGEHILNSMRYRSSGKKDNGGAIIVIGLGLLVIGYAGTFFGKWIKASVSRQREYLADASAVQFTRNKDTIAGALKKIGGLDEGSLLQTPSASEYSHAYFSDGVTHFFNSIFATHPPLRERIKKVDPNWNGRFISPKPIVENINEPAEKKAASIAGLDVTTVAILTAAEQAINQIGNINEENVIRKTGGLHVLVVDDSASVRKQLEIELDMFDVAVDFADSAGSAFTLLNTNVYDLALLDVVLPDKDGFQICKFIKANNKETIAIMLTGKATQADKIKGSLAGCDDYLIKPVGRATFQNAVKNYIPLKTTNKAIEA